MTSLCYNGHIILLTCSLSICGCGASVKTTIQPLLLPAWRNIDNDHDAVVNRQPYDTFPSTLLLQNNCNLTPNNTTRVFKYEEISKHIAGRGAYTFDCLGRRWIIPSTNTSDHIIIIQQYINIMPQQQQFPYRQYPRGIAAAAAATTITSSHQFHPLHVKGR